MSIGVKFKVDGLIEFIEQVKRPDMRIIEVGSWRGWTAWNILYAIKDVDGAVLYCVDHWQGSPSTRQPKEIERTGDDIYFCFLSNMFELGLSHKVIPLKLDSRKAAELFPNQFADLVFIDADHLYAEVKADIEAWWPKVKVGGILCGHDMQRPYSKIPDEYKTQEVLATREHYKGFHIGVSKAVSEAFGEEIVQLRKHWIWGVEKMAD